VSRTSSPAGMKPSSRIFSNIIYCAFHWASGVPRMVTLRSAWGSADVPSGSEVILTEEPEKRMMLRMCDPRVPMMAPTALFGM